MVKSLTHAVAQDPRDRPRFRFGQVVDKIDGFQRPATTCLRSKDDQPSSPVRACELWVRVGLDTSCLVKSCAVLLCTLAAGSSSAWTEKPGWCLPRFVLTQTRRGRPRPPRDGDHPFWPLADRGHEGKHWWRPDHRPRGTRWQRPTPGKRLDFPKPPLSSRRWRPRTSSGRPHRQLQEARGKGSQRRRRRRTCEEGTHENGNPAMGPDCDRRQPWPDNCVLETCFHRLSGEKLPTVDHRALFKLMLRGLLRSQAVEQGQPIRTLKTSASQELTAPGCACEMHSRNWWVRQRPCHGHGNVFMTVANGGEAIGPTAPVCSVRSARRTLEFAKGACRSPTLDDVGLPNQLAQTMPHMNVMLTGEVLRGIRVTHSVVVVCTRRSAKQQQEPS